MGIVENYNHVKAALPPSVKLIAVSKMHPVEELQVLYAAGHKVFGENKVQELCDKQVLMPADVEWHLIGHLQTNKVKYIAPFVQLIHSIDSLKLLTEVDKQAQKNNRVIDCLLQFHIASEETKFGLDMAEAVEMLRSIAYQSLQNIRITGVMGMATFTEEVNVVRSEFEHLHRIFEEIKSEFFIDKPYFKEISMGMSDDYPIAVEEGSTMVRVGTLIFGKRNYSIDN